MREMITAPDDLRLTGTQRLIEVNLGRNGSVPFLRCEYRLSNCPCLCNAEAVGWIGTKQVDAFIWEAYKGVEVSSVSTYETDSAS
jgi:hypothetical protein